MIKKAKRDKEMEGHIRLAKAIEKAKKEKEGQK